MAENQKKALQVSEQKQVEFYGDELTAVRVDTGKIYVALPSMCHALGLNIQAQSRRINRHEVLSNGYTKLAILASFNKEESTRRRMGVLQADLVPLWLAGLSAKSVKPKMRSKIIQYQQEAAQVLWEAFQAGELTTDPTFSELLQQDTPEVQAYKMLQGILQLARNQIVIRSQLDEHENRLEAIETQLASPDHVVTQTQAMQISQSVKAVAIELGKQTKRNEFGGVYGEMYRKFEITSYKALPSAKFEECLAWLTEWHKTLVGDAPF